MDLAEVITGQLSINIRELKIQSHDGIFEGTISIYITNIEALNLVINRLRKIKGVERVKRIQN